MRPAVQSLWIGERLGTIQRLSIQSFLAQGNEFHLYTYDNVANVPAGTTLCDASSILPDSEVFQYQTGFGRGSYSAFSNLFRYRLLFGHGGWWVDTDVVCLQPMPRAPEYVFATELSPQRIPTAAACAIRSPCGAEYLRYCLEVCEAVDRATLQWGQIGPALMDDAIWRFGLERYLAPVHQFNPVNYFDFDDFTDPGFDFTRLAGSIGVHLWHQMWSGQGVDPDGEMPGDSLFGMLRDRYLGPRRVS